MSGRTLAAVYADFPYPQLRMTTPATLTHIFWQFLKAGGLTVGDGYAVVEPLRRSIVGQRQWMSEEEYDRLLALVQAVPGIFNVNFAAFLGHRLKGWGGSIAALTGMVLPPFVLLVIVACFFDSLRGVGWVHSFLLGARPAIIALLILPCLRLLGRSGISLSTIWIPVGAAIAIVLIGVSPVYVIAGFTFLGVLYAVQVLMHER